MLASYLDSTNLRPDASAKQIAILCDQAAMYQMAAVCINPYRVALACQNLLHTGVKVCTVIGFPLGAEPVKNKIFQAAQALENGADELDVVINLGAVKDQDHHTVESEIHSLLRLRHESPFLLKVIVETALLQEQELLQLTRLLGEAGVDYIKTSTGFSSRGVNLQDIALIKSVKSDRLKIKASGGIRTLDFALQLLEAGVDRIGSSSAADLVEEYRRRGG